MTTTPKTAEDCPDCAAKQHTIDQLRTTLDAVRIIVVNTDDSPTP